MGSWVFDDLAFADDATQIDEGSIELYCGATDLDDALTGHSPEKQIVNIGFWGNANRFQLDFIDLTAKNDYGGNIIFFAARFGPGDPYAFSVRIAGGGFGEFFNYSADAFTVKAHFR